MRTPFSYNGLKCPLLADFVEEVLVIGGGS
jgi:hypothetical protein